MESGKVWSNPLVDSKVVELMRVKGLLPPKEAIEEKYHVKILLPYEYVVEEWFLENYESLGFTAIRKTEEGVADPGDYAGFRDGRWVRVELEAFSHGFFLHKQEIRNHIDMIICLEKNRPQMEWKREELEGKEVVELKEIWGVKKLIHKTYQYDFLYDVNEDFRREYRKLLEGAVKQAFQEKW